MSIGSKKKDKDKDAKGASGGEESANYNIGSTGGGEGRSANTATGKQEPGSTTANDKLSTREDISTTQKETITSSSSSSSSPSQDQISIEPMMATAATSSSTTSTSKEVPSQYQYQQNYQQHREEQQSGINRALDETRDSIRKSIDEARSQIPRYTQTTNEYQEQTIQTAREIADNFLESQKEIINSLQSSWLPQIDAINRAFTSTWMSPRYFTQLYANMVSNFANSWVAAARLANNAVFANMQAFRASIQQTRDNTKEISRISVNTARSLEQTARDTANSYAPSPTSSGFYSGGGTGGGARYGFSEEQQPEQIPSRQNEQDMQNVMEAQNHIAGQRRQQTITDMPRAAAVGQALKDLRFPADKKRILLFLQERSNTNPDYQKMVSLLDKMEDRQYENVSDVTNAAGLVQ
jgi:Protein of unknown function (DUF2795)